MASQDQQQHGVASVSHPCCAATSSVKHPRNPNRCPSCAEPSVDGTDHVPGTSDLPEALCLKERKDGLGGWSHAGMGGRGGKKSRQPSEVGENDAREPVLLARARRRASGTLVLGTGTPWPGCLSARLWVQGQEFPTLFATPYGSNIPVSSSWLLFFRGLRGFLVRRKRCGQCRQSVACSVSIQPAEAKKSVRLCSCIYVSCLIAWSFGRSQAMFSSQKIELIFPHPFKGLDFRFPHCFLTEISDNSDRGRQMVSHKFYPLGRSLRHCREQCPGKPG